MLYLTAGKAKARGQESRRARIGVSLSRSDREAEMVKRASALFLLSLLATCGFAKDKNKNILPAYVLQAKTVAVVTDPSAGISIDDPRANEVAQKDVEAAFLKWGRFDPVSDPKTADLIVVVRKGNGHLVDDTIPDPRQSNGIDPANRGGSIGPSRGAQPGIPGQPGLESSRQTPQTGIADPGDLFSVFKGGQNTVYATPVWTYAGRDGLSPQTVPAVTAFKKALAAADKAEAEKH
jgi:hypothetical protein